MMYLWLIVGFILLVKGADFFVEGSSSVARKLKIPSVVVGLTIVSMGTSAPEAAVSLTASFDGSAGISLGNIIGSNIFNLLVVIGACALIKPFSTNMKILNRDMIWNIIVSVVLLIMIIDGTLNWYDGLIFLVGMIVYMVIVVRSAIKNRLESEDVVGLSTPISIVYIIGGLAAVVIGGNLVVDNASLIAAQFGMSDTLIGLTICAIGTSLPELVTSIVAARKGESGIALGNAVGSCLFNILFILGGTSVINQITVDSSLVIDAALLIFVSILIYIFARSKKETSRLEGAIYIAIYAVYTAYIIIR